MMAGAAAAARLGSVFSAMVAMVGVVLVRYQCCVARGVATWSEDVGVCCGESRRVADVHPKDLVLTRSTMKRGQF